MAMNHAATTLDGDFSGRLVLTCEHAGTELPAPWVWPEADTRLVGTHWASDIGAGAFTERLAIETRAPAVLSNFTRLLVDPNRPLDSDTLFRSEADGEPVWLNVSLSNEERQRRIDGFYRPYHDAADDLVRRSQAEIVLGIHTFTANYEGNARSLEVGVLFDAEQELGEALVTRLREAGFVASPNEPYSGKDGLAYSPVRHAVEFGRRALEIEARQDLIVRDDFAGRLAGALAGFFG
ncbi:MAG: N-formylglutamate amidohydrolase [Myxococcota bacterium]